ncbi:rhodanese-like domain-containing protein [Corynebacterium tuberculostearicum]|uniref:rhodanese-like domain-containing protein n=1 Tax=Corynebacterium tuberculostearicum TaxID=38304 RepID=UPI0029350A76|nr:rhodanese-like domain-containing protein [Corynebacterium tuberculostearicum]MDV2430613.1 rhodanese-like domain-containing protein [Corynebacterium tuberculostearicum]
MKNVQPTEVPEGAQLIDVRENDEWAVERAKGATHIPMSEITGRIQEIDPDKDIYVICHAGGRSLQVCQYLEHALGWDTINVDGGTDKWKAAGLPIETD